MKLISTQYFRKETDVSQAVDDVKLDNPIKWAESQLKFYLGTDFYDEIVDQYPDSLTDDNTALYDPYIMQFLAWQAYEYYVVKANFSESRTGFRVHLEENSQIAGDKQMGELIRMAKQQAQFFKGEMISYIVKQKNLDSTKYPLFTVKCDTDQYGSGTHITKITGRNRTQNKIDKEIYGS